MVFQSTRGDHVLDLLLINQFHSTIVSSGISDPRVAIYEMKIKHVKCVLRRVYDYSKDQLDGLHEELNVYFDVSTTEAKN